MLAGLGRVGYEEYEGGQAVEWHSPLSVGGWLSCAEGASDTALARSVKIEVASEEWEGLRSDVPPAWASLPSSLASHCGTAQDATWMPACVTFACLSAARLHVLAGFMMAEDIESPGYHASSR